MIKQIRTSPWKRAAVLAIVPLFGLFFWASAEPHYRVASPSDAPATQETEIPLAPIVETDKAPLADSAPSDTQPASQLAAPAPETTAPAAQPEQLTAAQIPDIQSYFSENKLFIIDGKETTKDAVNQLIPNDIHSVAVIKAEVAYSLYGEKGKNGVVLIQTKTYTTSHPELNDPKYRVPSTMVELGWTGECSENVIVISSTSIQGSKGAPLIVLDGQEQSSEFKLSMLDPKQIASMVVSKDDASNAEYGDRGKNGVVYIKTKK